MNLFELFVKIGVKDEASQNVGKISEKLGNGLKTAAKVGTAAVTAAATGIAALTTGAVKNYAEYEQLVGGVDTLFKKSSDKVQQYAANAYKTAGMSANEYMNTVTSFSASLLQSLGGDTDKAAEKADLAITDMSDNANKMGTDISMIQNAYQGFAKQNYTMLDNLKLGYGGTKEEMERLLADAQKISGIEYDISSYADIVDAIHVIQTEMDITGTTAKEAGTTIQGSVNSMKGAWTNLLTGLADKNADISALIDNLITSIVGDGTETNLGVLGNILPAVKTALNGASRLVGEILPKIIQIIPGIIKDNLPMLASAAVDIIKALVNGMSFNSNELLTAVIGTVEFIAESLIKMLPQIVKLGLELIISLANGIAGSITTLIPTIIDVVLQIIDTLTNPTTLVSLVKAALDIILALSFGLIDAIPKLVEAIPVIIGNLVQALMESVPQIIFAAVELVFALVKGLVSGESQTALWSGIIQMMGSFLKGIASYYGQLIKKGAEIFTKIKDGFMKFIDAPKQWGKDLIDNFIGGILEKWEKLKKTVLNVAQSIKDFLGFSEPKKGPLSNFHTYAPDMMDLFAKGIKDNEKVVTAQIAKSFDFGEQTIGFGAEYAGGAGRYSGGGTSFGNITINIDGARYSNEESLAEAIAEKIQIMADRGAAVYA